MDKNSKCIKVFKYCVNYLIFHCIYSDVVAILYRVIWFGQIHDCFQTVSIIGYLCIFGAPDAEGQVSVL